MAKAENLSTMERHVEKLVLLVCVLAMGLAVWHWVLSSPVLLTVVKPSGQGTRFVGPEAVDGALKAAAENIQQQYKSAKRTIPQVPQWAGEMASLRNMTPLPGEPTNLAQPRLPMAPVTPQRISSQQIRLAGLIEAMPIPSQPVVMASVELPRKPDLKDAVVARGSSVYPLAQLTAAWKDILKSIPFEAAVPYQVIVEVQQAPDDGDWAKAKTVIVKPLPLLDEKGEPVEMPVIPDFDGKNFDEVRKARDLIATTWRQRILTPAYLPVWIAAQKQWTALAAPQVEAPAGSALISFFDDGTMTVGPSYRYRLQLVMVNPLLTYDEAVAKEAVAEARQKLITGKPGEWSAPVSVQRDVHFFLTGANEMTRKMSVTVYARKWGQWVRKTFEVQPGESIGGVEKVDVIDPLGQGKRAVGVDFTTGAVALRFDFKKMLYRQGFKSRTSEMLYLGADGQMQLRLKNWDDESELRKELEDAARKAATE